MLKIEKTIRKVIVVLGIFMIFITVLIEYAFNIQFFHQVVIITFNLIIIPIFFYFYVNPEFLIQKRKEIFLLIVCILIFLIIMETTLRVSDCGWEWEFFPDEELKYKYEVSKKVCNPIKENNKKYQVISNNEGFIDDDFEDTNGTASWSTTGSVTFTSGQIALSSSIDFNNGTITKATLDRTIVSGTFTYELTANGGTNWETVTSGTAHTFTNSGTDLRFRITESAATTGEISQVLVTNYH